MSTIVKLSCCSYCCYSLICSVCLLGNRSLMNENFEICAKTLVVENNTVPAELWNIFCNTTCDKYFLLNNLTEMPAIPGLLSGVIKGGGQDGVHLNCP